MSERSMLRLIEARIDELAGRVRMLEQQFGDVTVSGAKPTTAEPIHKSHMSTAEAAEFLGVSESMLERWRCDIPGGPPFIKIGRRVVYSLPDLEEFSRARRQRGLL